MACERFRDVGFSRRIILSFEVLIRLFARLFRNGSRLRRRQPSPRRVAFEKTDRNRLLRRARAVPPSRIGSAERYGLEMQIPSMKAVTLTFQKSSLLDWHPRDTRRGIVKTSE